jgi:hypothetical protein
VDALAPQRGEDRGPVGGRVLYPEVSVGLELVMRGVQRPEVRRGGVAVGERLGVVGFQAGVGVDSAGRDPAAAVAVQDEVADVVGEVTLAAVVEQVAGDRVGWAPAGSLAQRATQ